jgi:hypothetical protein
MAVTMLSFSFADNGAKPANQVEVEFEVEQREKETWKVEVS